MTILLFFISWKGSSYVAGPDASRTPVSISNNSDILIILNENSSNLDEGISLVNMLFVFRVYPVYLMDC